MPILQVKYGCCDEIITWADDNEINLQYLYSGWINGGPLLDGIHYTMGCCYRIMENDLILFLLRFDHEDWGSVCAEDRNMVNIF